MPITARACIFIHFHNYSSKFSVDGDVNEHNSGFYTVYAEWDI